MKIYSTTAPVTDDIGIADNDIDGFLKNLLASINREAAQNSNDEAKSRPVKMEIDLIEVPVSEIPDIEEFRTIIKKCLIEAETTEAKKAEEFFTNAQRVLGEETVKILSISDEGTKGAGGEFKKGGKFYTLAVSKGRTDKANLYSAGSFGIGKNAAFAGSQLRTVFYSSKYDEGFYCMGKSVLTSWSNNDGDNMGHKIFFSADADALKPVAKENELPAWLRKDNKGLKVSTVAPRIELKNGWKHGYIASLLSNFFVAIYDGNLEFSLDNGSVRLNKSTMLDYFSDPDVLNSAQASAEDERLKWAKACTEAFLADDFISETINVEHLGEFEVLLKVAEDLPKKVCIVRNGMFITNTLEHFGKPLKKFPSTKDFIAIVRPRAVEDPASEAIKRMENPEHNELTTSYVADETEVEKLNGAMLKLELAVRQIIKKHAKMVVTEKRDVDELREFFQKPGDDSDDSEESNETDPTKLTVVARGKKPLKPWKVQTPGSGSGGTGRSGGKPRKKPGRKGPGKGGKGGFEHFPGTCHAVKTSGGLNWTIKIDQLPKDGTLEFWPEEEPRSGRDSRPIEIASCSVSGAKIAHDRLSIVIPLNGKGSRTLSVDLGREVTVVDMRPVVREASK
jgi:hypothetical protein